MLVSTSHCLASEVKVMVYVIQRIAQSKACLLENFQCQNKHDKVPLVWFIYPGNSVLFPEIFFSFRLLMKIDLYEYTICSCGTLVALSGSDLVKICVGFFFCILSVLNRNNTTPQVVTTFSTTVHSNTI